MKKIYISVVVVACVAVFVFFITKEAPNTMVGHLNATYRIDGKDVTLVGGKAEESIPGSVSKIVTRFFGNEVKADFNDDGTEDIAFILTQETGGSGIFFYFVAFLNGLESTKGTDGVLLGDRIAPQSTTMGKGKIVVVNYADRNYGEPFTTKPSLGKSMWLLLDPETMQFGQVAVDFEGEADPSRMNLSMKTWNWIITEYSNELEVRPLKTEKFTITFRKDNTFSATTDCNSMGGEYTENNKKISFSQMTTTLMYCENSQEEEFTKMLNQIEGYRFTSKGELVFSLKANEGSMIFR